MQNLYRDSGSEAHPSWKPLHLSGVTCHRRAGHPPSSVRGHHSPQEVKTSPLTQGWGLKEDTRNSQWGKGGSQGGQRYYEKNLNMSPPFVRYLSGTGMNCTLLAYAILSPAKRRRKFSEPHITPVKSLSPSPPAHTVSAHPFAHQVPPSRLTLIHEEHLP